MYIPFNLINLSKPLGFGHKTNPQDLTDSIKIFRLQRKIIRIVMGCRSSESCRKLF